MFLPWENSNISYTFTNTYMNISGVSMGDQKWATLFASASRPRGKQKESIG